MGKITDFPSGELGGPANPVPACTVLVILCQWHTFAACYLGVTQAHCSLAL